MLTYLRVEGPNLWFWIVNERGLRIKLESWSAFGVELLPTGMAMLGK